MNAQRKKARLRNARAPKTGLAAKPLKLEAVADRAEAAADRDRDLTFHVEHVDVSSLKPHPKNYLQHPADQLAHIVQSIKQHGFYKNIVVARDGTVLAGHGVLEAVKSLNWQTIPVKRLDVDPNSPAALKILAADNMIGKMAEIDDRELSELLKSVKDLDVDGLLGTGFDDLMLSNLVYVTRPSSEVADRNEAAEWVGMPAYEQPEIRKITLNLRTPEDVSELGKLLGLEIKEHMHSLFWPVREDRDIKNVRFIDSERESAPGTEAAADPQDLADRWG